MWDTPIRKNYNSRYLLVIVYIQHVSAIQKWSISGIFFSLFSTSATILEQVHVKNNASIRDWWKQNFL